MPVTEYHQPARPIGGGGGRGRLGLAAWVVGLAGIVIMALNGRAGPGEETAAAPSAAASAAAVVAPTPGGVLWLHEPPTEVTTVAIHVRGHAAASVDDVELILLWANTALRRQTVRPTASGMFSGLFTVGSPRAASTVTILALARDADGTEVGAVRGEVRLAALHEAVRRSAPERRRGEDGLMGSLAVDPAWQAGRPGWSGRSMPWAWPVGRLGWQVNPAQL